jgi:hypothetical protein
MIAAETIRSVTPLEEKLNFLVCEVNQGLFCVSWAYKRLTKQEIYGM